MCLFSLKMKGELLGLEENEFPLKKASDQV